LRARAELREWLADLTMLERRATAVEKHHRAFDSAYKAALSEAAKAAVEYATAVNEGANGG
jgi:hypothetical protein